MSDPNDFVRARLRQAREEARLTQQEVAEAFGCAQVKISDIERGRSRVTVPDLIQLAEILGKPILYFLPVLTQSDLTEREQALVGLFRQFDDLWQENLLDNMQGQLQFYNDLKAVEDMPEGEDKVKAALEYRAKVWEADGVWVVRDQEGNPGIVGTPFPAYVNMLLTEERYREAMKYIDTLSEDKKGEAAYVMLYGILAPHGVYIAADDDGLPLYDESAVRQFAETQSEEFAAILPRLIDLACAPVGSPAANAEDKPEQPGS